MAPNKPHGKRGAGPPIAPAAKRAAASAAAGAGRFTFDEHEDDLEDDEEQHHEEELAMVPEDEGDEGEEGDEEENNPRAAATGYYAANGRRRKSSRLQSTSLAELPGGDAQELAQRVHAVMSEEEEALHRRVRAQYGPHFCEWRSLLHGGSSLLLHGFGSKRRLLVDFVGSLGVPRDKVVEFQGHSVNARPRELLVEIMQRLGLPQHGGTAAC